MNEKELQWDDVIEKDASDFVILPEGDYDFTVESFDRARHNGSDKLPPCNKAVIKIRIDSEQGPAYIKDASDEERLNMLLQMMMDSGRRQLTCYRKVRF